MLLAAASAVVLAVLLAFLIQQWAFFGWSTRIVFTLLAIGLALTVRTQVLRLWFRLRFSGEAVQIVTPLSERTIPWQEIVDVRRLAMRQVGGERRWACAVYTRTRRGTILPTYLFDDQLEGAEAAFAAVERRAGRSMPSDK